MILTATKDPCRVKRPSPFHAIAILAILAICTLGDFGFRRRSVLHGGLPLQEAETPQPADHAHAQGPQAHWQGGYSQELNFGPS